MKIKINEEADALLKQLIHDHIVDLSIGEYNFHYNIDVMLLYLTYRPANILISYNHSLFKERQLIWEQ